MSQEPEDITLRAATAADDDAIRWLEEVCMKDLALAIWGKWHPSPAPDLSCHEMIEHRGAVIGCMASRDEPDTLVLTRLYLASDARNRGWGAVCLGRILTRTRARGVPVRLRVLVNNPAICFYKRHGFVAENRSPTHVRMIHRATPEPQEHTT